MTSIPTRALSLKFDKIFNNLYDETNVLDNKIITNERLIEQNMKSYITQEIHNNSLRIISIAFFLICIVVLLYRLNLFDSLMILTIIIVAIIILAMLLIYYLYYMYDYNSYIERVSRNTRNSLLKKSIPIGNELNCDYLQEEESNLMVNNNNVNNASYNRSLQTTNTNFNVWSEGDHISTKDINENNNKNVDLDMIHYRNVHNMNGIPVSTDVIGKFNGLPSNVITYEQCEYIGANHNGMPLKNKYKYSTIPCKYYIDYKSNGKYIKNANNNYVKI
jgi:hypothetical protein